MEKLFHFFSFFLNFQIRKGFGICNEYKWRCEKELRLAYFKNIDSSSRILSRRTESNGVENLKHIDITLST